MLVKDFYAIDNKQVQEDGSVIYSVSLNPGHDVYKGHFPEKPITPGVCNIQMIKELAEDAQGKQFTLKNIDRCRLTSMVTPDGSPKLDVKIQFDAADAYKLSATIFYGETTFMTLTGTLVDKLQ
ncbi:MAG: hypothetical protein IKQ46_09545 [Bacteroidales bacterium]|jgi:3-hydroxyacyl-[acyl-carrier-protein] dehydratase|nr:hypothetical protein [Bacteroidales bacterium]